MNTGIVLRSEGLWPRRQFAKIKAAGFDRVVVVVRNRANLHTMLEGCRAAGLATDAIFAPLENVCAVWEKGDAGDAAISELCNRVEEAADYGISVVALQAANLECRPPSRYGLERFRRLAAFAEERGTHLCLENRRDRGQTELLLKILDEGHGFFWNTAHNAVFQPYTDFIAHCGDRLRLVCLEDYLRTEDGAVRHLLPFDGETDWASVARRLRALGYSGGCFLNAIPGEGVLTEEFLADAYQRLRRFNALLTQEEG